MRSHLAAALLLSTAACSAQVTDPGPASDAPDALSLDDARFAGSGKADGAASLRPAWQEPRTLRPGETLEEQAVGYDIALGAPTESEVEQHTEEDGDVVIEISEERPGRVELEFGAYYLELERDGAVRLEVAPLDEGYEARFGVKGPADESFHTHDGNELLLEDAVAGRTKVAVMAGVMPDFQGTLRYRITATRLGGDDSAQCACPEGACSRGDIYGDATYEDGVAAQDVQLQLLPDGCEEGPSLETGDSGRWRLRTVGGPATLVARFGETQAREKLFVFEGTSLRYDVIVEDDGSLRIERP